MKPKKRAAVHAAPKKDPSAAVLAKVVDAVGEIREAQRAMADAINRVTSRLELIDKTGQHTATVCRTLLEPVATNMASILRSVSCLEDGSRDAAHYMYAQSLAENHRLRERIDTLETQRVTRG